jgi:hypothetical protein
MERLEMMEKWRWRSARDGEVGDDGEVEMSSGCSEYSL